MKFRVSNVKITNAVKNGTITLGENAAWAATTDANNTIELTYSTAAFDILKADLTAEDNQTTSLVSGQQYILPIAGEYTVTFTVSVYNGDVKVNDFDKTVKIPASVAFARGNSYNFTCALTYENVVIGAEPILFNVTEVTEWNAFGNTDLTL